MSNTFYIYGGKSRFLQINNNVKKKNYLHKDIWWGGGVSLAPR